jgi:hypothetical protein
VPVGCVPLAVIHPPLEGDGWVAESGCCTTARYHRTVVNTQGGELWTAEQFAIDFLKVGSNNSVLKAGDGSALIDYWAYGNPVFAVAPGVVVEVTPVGKQVPNTTPVKTNPRIETEEALGNHVIEDIGSGRYVEYAHLKPGSIPTGLVTGSALSAGEQIGNVGSSGNSFEPHLHFQLMDQPHGFTAHGLPFEFDTQMREGSITEAQIAGMDEGDPVTIDPAGAGEKHDLMPARNDVFGFPAPPPASSGN